MPPNFLPAVGCWAFLREWRGGEGTALVVGRNQLNESSDFVEMTSRLQKNPFGTAELRWPTRLGQEESSPAGCSK